jgi:methyl-accepting chemotaxis protein
MSAAAHPPEHQGAIIMSAATPHAGPPTARRLNLGIRGKLLLIGLVGVLGAVAIGAVGVRNASDAHRAAGELRTINNLAMKVKDVNFENGDITGWQLAYALDARRFSPQKAIDPTNPNRAGFLTAEATLKKLLASFPVDAMTAHERTLFAEIEQQWDRYFEADDQVVAAYRQGDHAGILQAEKLIDTTVLDVYMKVVDNSGKLSDSIVTRADRTAASAQSNASTSRTLMLLAMVIVAGAVAAVALLVARRILGGLDAVRRALRALAAGDLTVAADVRTADELAQMATDYESARASVAAIVGTVVESAAAVATASHELSASSQQIAAGAEETSVQAGAVSTAAEEVSRNVQTVAAGSEQMGMSIREIAHSAHEAARVASEAVAMVGTTNEKVGQLGRSSQEIGNVVKVITSIAEQTNLLALNATIEAARAGQAGQGFAVVANEVKQLAQETAQATEDISRRVEAIQSDTTGAVDAIGEIATVISLINDHQMTIASAVEEQTATTSDMSRSVTEASVGSGQIAANIAGVSAAADGTTRAVHQTLTAADELARMSQQLRDEVGRFTMSEDLAGVH